MCFLMGQRITSVNLRVNLSIKQLLLFSLIFFVLESHARTFQVENTEQLYNAIAQANSNQQSDIVVLTPGIYNIAKRVIFTESNTQVIGLSDHSARDVVLNGKGMRRQSSVEVLLDVQASNITVSGLTLQNAANHLVQVRSEKNADNFTLTHCVLRDAYEQLLKVSSSASSQHYSDNGRVEHCVFEYSAGIGPQYYIGGIDAHRSRNWVVNNNTFKGIASPSNHVAEHAVHFWNDSSGTVVTNNIFINNDRSVGFGLGMAGKQHVGGEIRDNVFFHSEPSHPFADASITLEKAPGTKVLNNTIMQLHNYPNAIEYRFSETKGVLIQGNRTNRKIRKRNGGSATLADNLKLQ